MLTHKYFIRSMKDILFFLTLLLGVFLFQNALMVQNSLVPEGTLPSVTAQDAADDDDDAAGDDDDFEDEGDDDAENVGDDDDDDDLGDDDDDDMEDENLGDDDDDESGDDESGDDDDEEAKPKSRLKVGEEEDPEAILNQYKNKVLYETKRYQYGDASIREILLRNPTTVLELVDAAHNFANLSRFDLANLFYKKALDAGPSAKDVTKLVTIYGRAFFATLSENPNLAPHGNAFGKFILGELEKRFSTDPDFINEMIDQLSSPDEQERKVALTELLTYQSLSLPALLEVYTKLDPKTDARKVQTLETALQNFGDALVSGLGAMLDSGDPKRLTPICRFLKILAGKKNRDALMLLLYSAVINGKDHELSQEVVPHLEPLFKNPKMMKAQIATILKNQISAIQKEKQVLETIGNDDSVVVVWRWNPESKTIFPTTANRLVKYRQDSYRFARAFWDLYPDDPESRKLFFMTTSEYTATFMDEFQETSLKTNQLVKTPEFQKLIEEFSIEEMETYLSECLDSQFYDAAILAVLALGENGDESILQSNAERKNLKVDPTLMTQNSDSYSLLVKAIQSPNRLLRFAALQTIMKLNPQKPYPGSSRVIETMAWFLNTTGRSEVLVGAKNSAEATFIGGRFFKFGFNFDTGTNIKEIVGKALESSDYTAILMNVELLANEADLLLQQLKLDPRTADIPLVLLASPDDFKTAELMSHRIPKCIWFPIPARDEDIQLLITAINQIKTSVKLTPEQRVVQTRATLVWASEIMRTHQGGWAERLPIRASETPNSSILDESQEGSEEPKAETADPSKDPQQEEIQSLLDEAKKREPVNLLTEIKTDNRPGLSIDWGKPAALYDVTPLVSPVLKLYFNPEFLKESLEVLRWIGSPRAQQSLAFIGTSGTFSYSASKRAARILRENTLRYGVLLKTQAISDLYDLYNNTPEKNVKLLEVRGMVLDALEAPLNSKSQPDATLDEEIPEEDETAEETEDQTETESDDESDEDEEDMDEEEDEEKTSSDDEEDMDGDEEDYDDEELETVDEDGDDDDVDDDELEEDGLNTDDQKADEQKPDEQKPNTKPDGKSVELSDDEIQDLEDALDQEIEPLD
ncbi:MAG: hypothetical protein IJU53_10775 [Thermoguttaceae bacterium]|nr:hypothetical protein [Thermoguttaceae bacterium]